MNKRRYGSRLLISALISLLTILYVIGFTEKPAMDALLITAFGGDLFYSENTVISLLAGMLPLFTFSFLFADYVEIDFTSCCVYIFTRSGSRLRWMFKKIFGLLGWIAAFYLVLMAAAFALAALWKINYNFETAARLCAPLLLFDILNAAFLMIPLTLAAIRFGAVSSFFVCNVAYGLLLFAGVYAKKGISVLLPTAQGLYAWHEPLWLIPKTNRYVTSINGFSLWGSLFYLFIVIAAELCAGMYAVNKEDLLGGAEE